MTKEDIMENRAFSPKEVSKMFFGGHVGYATVLSWARTGVMPFHRVGSRYYIWHDELNEWLSKNREETETGE